jgi:hypothetical protein
MQLCFCTSSFNEIVLLIIHVVALSPLLLLPPTMEAYPPSAVMSLWPHYHEFLLLICKECSAVSHIVITIISGIEEMLLSTSELDYLYFRFFH